MVIAEQQFRDEEYQVPKDILTAAGIEVVTASTTTEEAVGKLGLKVRPDLLVSDIKPDDYGVLVFVGGGGSAQYFDDAAFMPWPVILREPEKWWPRSVLHR